MGTSMNALITASPQEISLLKNRIVQLRAEYKQAEDKEKSAILLVRLNAHLHHYQELTKPLVPSQQVG